MMLTLALEGGLGAPTAWHGAALDFRFPVGLDWAVASCKGEDECKLWRGAIGIESTYYIICTKVLYYIYTKERVRRKKPSTRNKN